MRNDAQTDSNYAVNRSPRALAVTASSIGQRESTKFVNGGSSRLKGLGALLITVLGWGTGWIMIKVVMQMWPPMFARGLAGMIAAALLAALARRRGEKLSVARKDIAALSFAAFTNVFAWMGLSALCLKWLPISEGVLLVYTVPIWAMLLSWILTGHRPTTSGFAALVLGLSGIYVLVGGNGLTFGKGQLLGITFALGSAVLFALGAVLNKRQLAISQTAFAAWQVLLGSLPMLAIGLLTEKPDFFALNAKGCAAMGYMVIVSMGMCYLTWFEALRRLPPAVTSISILLVPITSIVLSALLLAEPLGLREALAIVLTLLGVGLALRKA
jgi:drug/metabolite transporter (DMT)-like permease